MWTENLIAAAAAVLFVGSFVAFLLIGDAIFEHIRVQARLTRIEERALAELRRLELEVEALEWEDPE